MMTTATTTDSERNARDLIAAASRRHGSGLVMSTSFGIQSAALLHLATQVAPGIPILWVDTGYLPEQTYRFAADLEERLELNLHVASATLSPARMEALHGRLWERGEAEALQNHAVRRARHHAAARSCAARSIAGA